MKDYSFYLEGRTDKGVLLVHGLTGAPAEMKFVGKQLHKRGFTVYGPTLPGHCLDETPCCARPSRTGLVDCAPPCMNLAAK